MHDLNYLTMNDYRTLANEGVALLERKWKRDFLHYLNMTMNMSFRQSIQAEMEALRLAGRPIGDGEMAKILKCEVMQLTRRQPSVLGGP